MWLTCCKSDTLLDSSWQRRAGVCQVELFFELYHEHSVRECGRRSKSLKPEAGDEYNPAPQTAPQSLQTSTQLCHLDESLIKWEDERHLQHGMIDIWLYFSPLIVELMWVK